jgi:hypothetical protein
MNHILGFRKLIFAMVVGLVCASSCKNSPIAPQQNGTDTFNYVGHAFYDNDGGLSSQSPTVAVWSEATDSSSAQLEVSPDNGRYDTLFIERGSQGWQYAAKDPRHGNGWSPRVTQTQDSLIVLMSNGFVWTEYNLRKE